MTDPGAVRAQRALDDLMSRTEANPGVYQLAVHASLATAVDAELMHHLRDNFLLEVGRRERLPISPENEVAMADLLLSPLYHEIGDALWEMDAHVRTRLLSELAAIDGGQRIQDVAVLIERYVLDGYKWEDWPEMRAAQLVSAWAQLDPQAADEWLATGSAPGSGPDSRWFVAMRRSLDEVRAIEDVPGIALTREPAAAAPTGPGLVLKSGSTVSNCVRVTANGLLVAAGHAVDPEAELAVGPASGPSGPARLVGTDREADIAFLLEDSWDPANPVVHLDETQLLAPYMDVTVDDAAFSGGSRTRAFVQALGIGSIEVGGLRVGPGSSGAALLRTDRPDQLLGVLLRSVADSAVFCAADRIMAALHRVAQAGAGEALGSVSRLRFNVAGEIVTGSPTERVGTGSAPEPVVAKIPEELESLIKQYGALRETMPSGPNRTAAMTRVVSEMRQLTIPTELRDSLLAGQRPGERLAAVVHLQSRCDAAFVPWLADRLWIEQPFVGFQAAVALRNAAEYLPVDRLAELQQAIGHAREAVAELKASDRYRTLTRAEQIVIGRLEAGLELKHSVEFAVPSRAWSGQILRIRFLNGTPELHRDVQRLASAWVASTGVILDFLPFPSTGRSDVRVTFLPRQNWSYIGTDATAVADSEPTMAIDSEAPVDTARWKKEVLTAFGHALGLIPEHQNPTADIAWDREAVYRHFSGPPTHWTREKIDADILRRYLVPGYRHFDPQSVMLDDIPAHLTRDGRSYKGASSLSPSDLSFMSALYPLTRPGPEPARSRERDPDDVANRVSVSVQWPDAHVRQVDGIPFGEHSRIWTVSVFNGSSDPIRDVVVLLDKRDARLFQIDFAEVGGFSRVWYNLYEDAPLGDTSFAPGASVQFTAGERRYLIRDGRLHRGDDEPNMPLVWPIYESRLVAEDILVRMERPDDQVRADDQLAADENWWVVSVSNASDHPIMNVQVTLTDRRTRGPRRRRQFRIGFPPIEPGRRHWWILRPDSGFADSDPMPAASAEFDALGRRWQVEGRDVKGGEPASTRYELVRAERSRQR